MKKLFYLIPALLLAGIVYYGCQENMNEPQLEKDSNSRLYLEGTCGSTTWTLWAGQSIDVGTLTAENDLNNIYVTYTLNYQNPNCVVDGVVDAEFGTLHLWVGDDFLNVPANPQGTPVPGQFPYSFDATGLQTYTFTIPFSELGITDVNTACDKSLYVVAHAEVILKECDGTEVSAETAFGGDHSGSGPRWWYYGVYKVCCEFGPPPVPFCQTAYAKGGYVWTTQRRSNPEELPSLELTRNRWGWAIELMKGTDIDVDREYDIWAGAGLNDISKGVLVGKLTVIWDGYNVTVTYTMLAGYCLQEVHLYAGDDSPTTIAPGQYGNLDYFDPNVNSYTFNVPLVDGGDGSVWLVAHAVVCNECP